MTNFSITRFFKRRRAGLPSTSFSSKSSAGFTLIELLVVVSIIGILAGLIIVNVAGVRERARDAARKRDLDQIKKALRLYYNDFQNYPGDDGQGRVVGCGVGGVTACSWEGEFSADGTVYMRFLPVDPTNSGQNVFFYSQTSGGDGFMITDELENASDEDSERTQQRCGLPVVPLQYVVCED